jgi:hypothetical protein
MTQRNLFINGLILLAVLLFGLRMWLVNPPDTIGDGIEVRQTKDETDGTERIIHFAADQAGWRPIAKGPIVIRSSGTIDIGGQRTVPDDEARPGDEKALVPTLPYGMLVGKIGEKGQPFKIGKIAQVAIKDTVYIAINDSDYSDNSGTYTVKVTHDYIRDDAGP